MTRENFIVALLLFACGVLPSLSGAAERKLVWTFPCTFKYNDVAKSLYETKISSPECDFIHATFGKNSTQDFNNYALTAQQAFLIDVGSHSAAAYHLHKAVVEKLLKETDPAKLSPSLSPKARLEKLMGSRKTLIDVTIASFKPFQWEQMVGDSYLDNRGGGLPKSWSPYIDPIRKRAELLNQMIQPLQSQMIGDAAAGLATKIKVVETLKAVSSTPQEWLAKLFDGGSKGPGAPGAAGQPGKSDPSKAVAPSARLGPYSPKLAPPAPLPQTAQAQAKYGNFNRGYKEGMQRVADEASLAWWHYTGQTRTVGDPVGKSNLVFHQEGGSCALGAQFQALQVRGKIPPAKDDKAIRAFVQQAQQDGAFVEIRDKSGGLYGGTSFANLDRMLTAYNVPHALKLKATQQDLDRAVLQNGDAIVTVNAALFWQDPQHAVGHAVYVTGAEVDKTGKVVGYYFNDTGTGEGARFVTAADFNKAWTHGLISFTPAHGK
ncbi:MAG: hypothetical protein NTY77_12850 [Elusimicrobia bacterium]|nr:hypothetical protein [Elusimicrobiota bacterium]